MTGVAFDLDGDGRSELLTAYPHSPGFPLILNGSIDVDGGQARYRAIYGQSPPLSLIAVADFDGDGKADFAAQDTATGVWYVTGMQMSGRIGPASLSYGVVGTGDLNGDGHADLVFRNAATGDWGYMSVVPHQYDSEVWHSAGPSSTAYAAIGVGDFDGDGQADVAFRNTTTGDWGYMSANPGGSGETWHALGPTSTAYAVIGVGDFDGDGRADAAFRNTTAGDWGFMSANPAGSGEIWRQMGPTSLAYDAVAVGDYNGDGRDDIAFQNAQTKDLGFMSALAGGQHWTPVGMNATTRVIAVAAPSPTGAQNLFVRDASGQLGYLSEHASIPYTHDVIYTPMGPSSLDYAPIGSADFNGDGVADLAFRNVATGDWGYMAPAPNGPGETWHAAGPTSVDYTPGGVGDFNGDGVWDLVFRNDATGDMGYMDANPHGGETWHHFDSQALPGYTMVGVGDFGADGLWQIALRNTSTGDWGVMFLGRPFPVGFFAAVGPTSLDYAVAGVGDFDGDGRADLLFMNPHTFDEGFMSVGAAGGEIWHSLGAKGTSIGRGISVMTGDFDGNGYAEAIEAAPNMPSHVGLQQIGPSGQVYFDTFLDLGPMAY